MPIGPSRPLILHTPEAIDLRQAARYLGAQRQPDDATLALLERCAPPLQQAAAPRAAWLLADTETLEEHGILQGADIRQRQMGLYVTDTCLMTPRKSVTALLGLSDHPVTGQPAGCGHCALRARCDYRKRGITCADQ